MNGHWSKREKSKDMCESDTNGKLNKSELVKRAELFTDPLFFFWYCCSSVASTVIRSKVNVTDGQLEANDILFFDSSCTLRL